MHFSGMDQAKAIIVKNSAAHAPGKRENPLFWCVFLNSVAHAPGK
jgi:hypothetical protein